MPQSEVVSLPDHQHLSGSIIKLNVDAKNKPEFFKVKTVDKKAGQISYALAFTAKAGGPPHLVLARQSDQTIFVRGF